MKKKRLMAAGLSAAMVLSMTACGGKEAPAETKKEETKTEAAKEQAEQDSGERPYYVRPASEVTGKITVYTTMEETQQQVLNDIWKKYYPDCELEIQADSVGTLATRIRSDESCDADVVIGGMFAADGDTYHDILQPYTGACDKEQLYHDDAGYYNFYDVQVMCLVVNPALRDELGIEINGYEDLLNPALKGKIILAAPDSTSSGWRQLQTILGGCRWTARQGSGASLRHTARRVPATICPTRTRPQCRRFCLRGHRRRCFSGCVPAHRGFLLRQS